MLKNVLTILFIVLAVFVFIRLLAAPIKKIFKFLLNMLSGILLLLLTNFICGFFDFSIEIDLINVLISGILGIPGVILLVLKTLLF